MDLGVHMKEQVAWLFFFSLQEGLFFEQMFRVGRNKVFWQLLSLPELANLFLFEHYIYQSATMTYKEYTIPIWGRKSSSQRNSYYAYALIRPYNSLSIMSIPLVSFLSSLTIFSNPSSTAFFHVSETLLPDVIK